MLGLLGFTLTIGLSLHGDFRDVPPTHWAHAAVVNLADRGVLTGRPDGTFQGEKPVTRFELAVALDRFVKQVEAGLKKGGESLNDLKTIKKPVVNVPNTHWAHDAMLRLAEEGYLPISSKVLQGPGDLLTVTDVGQALGSVASRLAELVSHEPDDYQETMPGSLRDIPM